MSKGKWVNHGKKDVKKKEGNGILHSHDTPWILVDGLEKLQFDLVKVKTLYLLYWCFFTSPCHICVCSE